MSDRPPQDPDDLSLGGIVDEVVSQVRVALDEADISSRDSREMLMDGLREVFQAMDPGAFVRGREADVEPPDVTVVDGGRADDAPPTDGPRADLKVAEPERAPADASEPPAVDQPKVVTRVTVHDLGGSSRADKRPRIVLDPASDGAEWRSLFRGAVARPYRIAVSKGTVRIALDGSPSDIVRRGASLDVEAKLIQVSLVNEAGAVVRYERLPE